jgi:hypothetical protein
LLTKDEKIQYDIVPYAVFTKKVQDILKYKYEIMNLT